MRLLLVLLLAILPHLGALANGFAHDDILLVRENPLVRDGTDLAAIATADYWEGRVRSGLWRPLVVLSLSVEARLFGLDPRPFHATNVLLHAAAAAALLLLLDRLKAPPRLALAAAALFAVHPVHTEAVVNVAGRAELLSAIFVLLALRSHLSEAGSRAATGATAALFALALLCKEHAAVFPGLALVADLSSGRRPPLARHGASAAVLVLYLAARSAVLDGFAPGVVYFVNNPLASASASETFLAVPALLLRAALLLALPVRLSADYSYGSIDLPRDAADAEVVAGAAVAAAAVAAIAAALVQRRRVAAVALATALLPYAVVSHALVPLGTIFGERLLYLPSAGGAVLLAIALARAASRLAGRAVLCLFVLLFAVRSAERTPDWRDNETLWAATVARFPRNAKALAFLAEEKLRAHADRGAPGAADAALDAARRSTEVFPGYATGFYVLGKALASRGDEPGAIEALERSLAIEDAIGPRILLGEIRFRRGEFGEAESVYAGLVRQKPSLSIAHSNLAAARAALGREREALAGLETALALDPRNRDAVLNLFRLRLHAEDPGVRDEARARALAPDVLRFDPGNAEARALVEDSH